MWDVKPLLDSVLLYFLPFRKCKSPRSSLVQRSHNKKDTPRRVCSVSKKSDHDRYRSASYGWTTLSARQSAADFAKSCGTYACTARFGVGVDAHIDPADCTVFYGNLRRIRNFQAGRCRHRPLQSTARIHGCSSGRQRRPPLRQPRKPYTK